jgi:hypothetical protein
MMDFLLGEREENPSPVDQPVGCPKCGSARCHLQATGRKSGTILCGVLGAVLTAGWSGAEIGMIAGTAMTSLLPPAAPVGSLIGAVIGFSWGAIAGHALGTEIDERFLRLFSCLDCGAEFRS